MALKCCEYKHKDTQRHFVICTTDATCPGREDATIVSSWGVEKCEDCKVPVGLQPVGSATEPPAGGGPWPEKPPPWWPPGWPWPPVIHGGPGVRDTYPSPAFFACVATLLGIGMSLADAIKLCMDWTSGAAAPAGEPGQRPKPPCASPSPDLGSNSFPCAHEGDNPKGHVIFQSGDDNEKEVTVFVVPCPGGTIDLVGGKPKPKVGDDPNHPRPAERLSADSPQTLVVRGVTVGITCKGGKAGTCSYRIVLIK